MISVRIIIYCKLWKIKKLLKLSLEEKIFVNQVKYQISKNYFKSSRPTSQSKDSYFRQKEKYDWLFKIRNDAAKLQLFDAKFMICFEEVKKNKSIKQVLFPHKPKARKILDATKKKVVLTKYFKKMFTQKTIT